MFTITTNFIHNLIDVMTDNVSHSRYDTFDGLILVNNANINVEKVKAPVHPMNMKLVML